MSEVIEWLRSEEGEEWSRRRDHQPGTTAPASMRRDGRWWMRPRTRADAAPHPGRDSSDGGSGMTWHCASCRTTVTWATPDVKIPA